VAYPVLSDIKARLGISDSSQDAALQSALNAARGAVENYCGARWEYPDSETREFRLWYGNSNIGESAFDVANPGLLSFTAARAWKKWQLPEAIALENVLARRNPVAGVGPYERLIVRGSYDVLEVTGVWGEGLTAPDEVAECVMLVAMSLFAAGTGQGLAVDDEVDRSIFDDKMLAFLLQGHRRYR